MSERYVMVVSLWVRKGQEKAFEAFEKDAAQIMARHGGRIESAVQIIPPGEGELSDAPFEVHVVSFPNREAHQAYSTDPETQARKQRRSRIITRTEVVAGRAAGPYLKVRKRR